MVTGCSSLKTDTSTVIEAAGAAGARAGAEARIDIGPLPDSCYELIPYPPKILGEDARVQNRRWRQIVDEANRTHVIGCARTYYEKLRLGLAKGRETE